MNPIMPFVPLIAAIDRSLPLILLLTAGLVIATLLATRLQRIWDADRQRAIAMQTRHAPLIGRFARRLIARIDSRRYRVDEFVAANGKTPTLYRNETLLMMVIASLIGAWMGSEALTILLPIDVAVIRYMRANGRIANAREKDVSGQLLRTATHIARRMENGENITSAIQGAARRRGDADSWIGRSLLRATSYQGSPEAGIREEIKRADNREMRILLALLADGANPAHDPHVTILSLKRFVENNRMRFDARRRILAITAGARGRAMVVMVIAPLIYLVEVVIMGPDKMLHPFGANVIIAALHADILLAYGFMTILINGARKSI